MSAAEITRFVVGANVALAAAFLSLRVGEARLGRGGARGLRPCPLALHGLLAICALAAAAFFAGRSAGDAGFDPPLKVWAAGSVRTFDADYGTHRNHAFVSAPGIGRKVDLSALPSLAAAVTALLACGLALAGLRLRRDLRRLHRLERESLPLRRIGRVRVLVHSGLASPLSYWSPRAAVVVVPEYLLERPVDLRLSLLHELAHHRRRDTVAVYGWLALKSVFFYNPFVIIWSRWISELQELACDSDLVDRKKVDRELYSRCLLATAEQLLRQEEASAHRAAWSLGLVERHTLKRRIASMYTRPKKIPSLSVYLVGALALGLSLAAASATRVLKDQRVTMAEARELVRQAVAKSESEFPIVLNERVLKQLNRYLGTAEGQQRIRESLERKKEHDQILERTFAKYKMPAELAAVPIVESGYQNLPDKNKAGWGAGIWMFIKSTARIYGLKVNDEIDQRNDVALETDAAMRMLKAEHLKFKDWQLALIAYNMGQGRLSDFITKYNTRDAWELIDKGAENDQDYLAKVMAAIIVLQTR